MNIIKCVLIIILASPIGASSKSLIICHPTKGRGDVIITLDAGKEFGRILNCVDGDFIVDMTPCAPNAAYGLSYPTGSAKLRQIVDRWQDYMDHHGGVVSSNITESEIRFSGGFMTMNNGYVDYWSFVANRVTGKGILVRPKIPDVAYECRKADQKF